MLNEDEMNEGLGVEVIDVSADNAVAMDPITRAEIDIAITTAKRYPRRLDRFADQVTTMATIDRETAEGCFYSLRRQGRTIMGPSVRLAEIAVSAWGNIRAGARILGETEDGRFVRAMGVCHDLERNVYVAIEAQRRITNREGVKYGDDMVGVTSNAAAAIGFRNAVFKVIPKALLKTAYTRCVEVATGDAKTLTERREQVFERLKKLNPLITDEKILAAVERPAIDEVTLADVTHLVGLGTAIHDGHQSVDEAFPEQTRVQAEDVLGKKTEAPAPAPEDAVDEPPPVEKAEAVRLTPSQIAELTKLRTQAGISEEELVGHLGAPLKEIEGKDRTALEQLVRDFISREAKRRAK